MEEWAYRETKTGLRYLVCEPLRQSGLPHAFTLRPFPDSSPRTSATWLVEAAAAIGFEGSSVSVPRQVHGAVVARPSMSPSRTDPIEADAVLVKGITGQAAIATADCVGAVLHVPGRDAFAVIHAGWRGTLASVLPSAVRALVEATGDPASAMILAMGPAIGGCCYEVGDEVADAFVNAFPGHSRASIFGARNGRTTVDLVEGNRLLAIAAGIHSGRIFAARVCTLCRADLCWSYRGEGAASGRMWTLAGVPG